MSYVMFLILVGDDYLIVLFCVVCETRVEGEPTNRFGRIGFCQSQPGGQCKPRHTTHHIPPTFLLLFSFLPFNNQHLTIHISHFLMPRATVLDSSPLPVVGPSGLPPPTQPKRTQKRSVDETLLLTPPGTIKRERKRHNTPPASSRKGKTRNSNRGRASTTTRPGTRSAHETDSEAEVETELESLGGSDKVFGSSVACKLDFGRSAKRRRLGELDARLETLLELDGENAENPFWDGPSKKDNSKEDKDKASTEETKEGARDKHVRLRSPTPPLLNFRGKPPVSPPPSNRRKKGTRKSKKAATVTETIIEEPSESSKEVVIEEPSKEVTAEPSKEVPGELSKEEVSEETTTEEVSKEATEEVVEEPQIELPSTPKGKARSLPIRDSPNNPFLDDGASPSSAIDQLPEPRTPTAVAEKPTITYVLYVNFFSLFDCTS